MNSKKIKCQHCSEYHIKSITNYCPNKGKPLINVSEQKKSNLKLHITYILLLITFVSSNIYFHKLQNNQKTEQLMSPFDKSNTPEITNPVSETYPINKENLDKNYKNKFDMEFILINPVNFKLGSPNYESERDIDEIQNDYPNNNPFYIQTTEVTQKQWFLIMGEKPWEGKGNVEDDDDKPAVYISWNDCQLFIKKINKKSGSNKYRLPFEYEWQYASRAGSKNKFYWGDSVNCSKANFACGFLSCECDNLKSNTIMSVKSFDPNKWGLYEMHGNVWEWCQDDYKNDKEYTLKITKGGAWHSKSKYCRSANIGKSPPDKRYCDQGMRLVMVP